MSGIFLLIVSVIVNLFLFRTGWFTLKGVSLLIFNLLFIIYFTTAFSAMATVLFLFFIYFSGLMLNSSISGEKKFNHILIFISTLTVTLFIFITAKYEGFQKIIGLDHNYNFRNIYVNFYSSAGLSYLVFKSLHWIVDCYRGRINRFSILDFYNYFLFFPLFFAGPMDRYLNFQSWMKSRSSQKFKLLFYSGIFRILAGAFKLYFLSALFQKEALSFREVSWTDDPLVQMVAGSFYFSFYIYFNFSGLSDIAIGISGLFGFRAPENFNNPYFSENIADFWKRWHMTLSSIAYDYIFLPSVKLLSKIVPVSLSLVVTIAAYFFVFIIIGIWHGDALNYFYWGLWHGAGLSLYRIWISIKIYLPAPASKDKSIKIAGRILAGSITFIYVSLGWIFFQNRTVDLISVFGEFL